MLLLLMILYLIIDVSICCKVIVIIGMSCSGHYCKPWIEKWIADYTLVVAKRF